MLGFFLLALLRLLLFLLVFLLFFFFAFLLSLWPPCWRQKLLSQPSFTEPGWDFGRKQPFPRGLSKKPFGYFSTHLRILEPPPPRQSAAENGLLTM